MNMALFASNGPSLPSLTSRMEKMTISDGLISSLNSVHPLANSTTLPNGEHDHGDKETADHPKEPMHSILKTHGSGDEHKPQSAPVDIPMKKSASAPATESSSLLTGGLSTSPGSGSYQDLYKLWVDEDEDREFNKIIPPVRRSVSLKTQKTPPGTPSPKKMVRFADAMGLDLEKVRHFFQDQLPNTETAMQEDLPISSIPTPKYTAAAAKYLAPTFPQPCLASTFLDRVRSQKICLDSVQITDCLITGIIRVLNVAFDKCVIVRYTFDNWKTHFDTGAQYVPNSNDNFSDRFQFIICPPPYFSVGDQLQFCLCYRTGGQEYWDSNYGQNYSLICCAGSGAGAATEALKAFEAGAISPSTSAFW